MVAGIHSDLLQRNAASIEARTKVWNHDFSVEKTTASVTPNRERFKKIIGLIDERIPYTAPSIELGWEILLSLLQAGIQDLQCALASTRRR
jgi:hypothetical protein